MVGRLTIRKARPADAEAVARIYVESWRDTYPLVLPARLLSSMTVDGQTARWRNAIAIAARRSCDWKHHYFKAKGWRTETGSQLVSRGA